MSISSAAGMLEMEARTTTGRGSTQADPGHPQARNNVDILAVHGYSTASRRLPEVPSGTFGRPQDHFADPMGSRSG